MAEMGDGYGSECHLLRYLGRHRHELSALVASTIGADSVRWIDFHFNRNKRWLDGERKGLDFLPEYHPALRAWGDFWPKGGTPPNWDAVGSATIGGADQWLLVEAKAHAGELISACQAVEAGGLPQIRKALNSLMRDLGVADSSPVTISSPIDSPSWIFSSGMVCQRVCCSSISSATSVPTAFHAHRRVKRGARLCSSRRAGLGLEHEHRLSARIHKLFLPVSKT